MDESTSAKLLLYRKPQGVQLVAGPNIYPAPHPGIALASPFSGVTEKLNRRLRLRGRTDTGANAVAFLKPNWNDSPTE
ncbi:hypothetical protein VTK73DRAFT_5415 [Phialemonium thermophilum]|uniref:Uncharacterized protein n=1 Tax=Phialemonium thermophilum TaxID=223376 RepID=A0ABR3WNL6_9PEZI